MAKNLLKVLCFGGALLLSGCAFQNKYTKDLKIEQLEKGPEMVDYFAETKVFAGSGTLSTVVGDFNEDGHLDYIVTGTKVGDNGMVQSFLYLGDGKGNFKLKQYEKKK